MENLGTHGCRALLPIRTGRSRCRASWDGWSLFRRRTHSPAGVARLSGLLIVVGLFATAAVAQLGNHLSVAGAPRDVGATSSPLVFVQARQLLEGPLQARFPQGSRLVRLWPVEPEGRVKPLTSEFFAAADPQVSYDGKKILFAGQLSPGSKWQIWEMNADGSEKRQITKCDDDCVKPAYLPRGQIVFTALSPSKDSFSTLFVARLDGSGAHPITFGPGAFQVERVLADGRMLVSAEYPLQASGNTPFSRELYTLRPDGTGLRALRCHHEKGVVRGMVEELASGSLLFIKASLPNPLAGALVRLDRGATHNRPVSRPGSRLQSPIQLENGELVVAHPGSAQSSGPTATRKFSLYTFDLSRGSLGRLVYADPEFHSVSPVVVASRPVPKYFWSVVNPKLKVGYFICLRSHLTASGTRQELTGVPARVRVLTGGARGAPGNEGGEAPVESDGSFYVAVPADTPVRFQLLDENGRILQEQKSWIWVRPGEHRACLGCHEDRSRVPENAIPKILLRFDVPTPIGQPKTEVADAQPSP